MAEGGDVGKGSRRGPSYRGRVMLDHVRGVPRARSWPKKRKKGHRSALTPEQDWFLQAQWATKYWEPSLQIEATNAVAGTPLLPRDLMTMIMAGRAYSVTIAGYGTVYSVEAMTDVSEWLDVIAQSPGSMLWRNQTMWQALAPGSSGQVLTYGPSGQPPSWQDASGGGAYTRPRLIPQLADFTSIGPSPPTLTQGNYGISLESQAGGGSAVDFMRYNAGPPTAPYSIIAKAVSPNYAQGSATAYDAIQLRNSATGAMYLWSRWNGNLVVRTVTSFTSAVTNVSTTLPISDQSGEVWLRVDNNGTNLSFKYSVDGDIWIELYAVPIATFIGNVNEIGWGGRRATTQWRTMQQSFEVVF